MNVYDFDNTIFDGDSTARFIRYIMLHRPAKLIKLPGIGFSALLFGLKLRKKQVFKEKLFVSAFTGIDTRTLLADFWAENYSRVKKWYLAQRKEDDLIISASPRSIVLPCCERLGIKHVMGSPVDIETGLYNGNNCHGEEKVRLFREAYPDGVIDNFYSDSHSDDPLARIAAKAYMVKGETLTDWKFD